MKNALRLVARIALYGLALWGLICIVVPAPACAQPADLVAVNDQVNRSIRYRSDLDQYGVADWWVASPRSGEGDCEDYALTKQAILGRGQVAIVGYRNQVHAVLIVDGWVLDNIERRVVPLATARRYYTGL